MIRQFARYYRPHIKLFAADMFCALMIAAVDLLFPITSRYAMQNLLPQNAYAAFFCVMGRWSPPIFSGRAFNILSIPGAICSACRWRRTCGVNFSATCKPYRSVSMISIGPGI